MNISKLFGSVLIMLSISGCIKSQTEIVEEKQASYIGKPIETLIMMLGSPSASGEINGQEFYTWTNTSMLNISTPITNTARNRGTVYGSSGGYGNYSGSTTYTTYTNNSYQLNCTFNALAKSGKIIDISAKGQNGACSKFARAL